MTNQAMCVEVKVPAGRDRLDPHVKILPEPEALPDLLKLKLRGERIQ